MLLELQELLTLVQVWIYLQHQAGIVTVTVNVGAADTASIVSTSSTITDHLDLRDDNDDTRRLRIFHDRNVYFDDTTNDW